MRLYRMLQHEPAALGSTIASVLPALVLLGVVHVDENGIAALVMAVNAIGGFAVRLSVVPSPKAAPAASQPARSAPETGAA
jgi:hypothetical protein